MRTALGSPHLDEALIDRFLACQATRGENCTIVRHLLSGCPVCSATLRRRYRPEPDADYDSALTRVMEAWAERAKKEWGQVLPFRRREKAEGLPVHRGSKK